MTDVKLNCACVKERDMRLVEKTTVSGTEREREAVDCFSYLTSTTQGKKPISHQPADMNDEFCCLKPILHRDRIVGGTLDLL